MVGCTSNLILTDIKGKSKRLEMPHGTTLIAETGRVNLMDVRRFLAITKINM